MHDVESFAEQMIRLVDESDINNEEKIDLIHNIYQFHDSWDTGFTKLRVYHILIKTGYFRLFEPHEHPDYEKYKDFFDGLPNSNEMYIYENPIAGYSKDAKLTSYWFDYAYDSETDKEFPLNKMCCEAGSPVWAYFEGADKTPKEIPLISLFCRLTELAAEKNDIYAMGELYYIMVYGFLEFDSNHEENIKCVEKMKPILLRDEVMENLAELCLDYMIGSREDLDEDEDLDETPQQLMHEWFEYYLNWKEKQSASKNSSGIGIENMKMMANNFRSIIIDGDVDLFFKFVKENNEDFRVLKGLLLLGDIYSNITPGGHEKISSYDINQTENENIKSFVTEYREWYENKENVNYYVDKARENLNINSDMLSAQYYIWRGLILDPSNAYLKLYEIYIFVNFADNEKDKNPLKPHLENYLEILNGIFENGLDKTEWNAFAHYMKAAVLYNLDDKDASRIEMKKAIELNPDYAAAYEEKYGKEN
jgi:hypothetical protein